MHQFAQIHNANNQIIRIMHELQAAKLHNKGSHITEPISPKNAVQRFSIQIKPITPSKGRLH